jgi:hypothetical protein
VGACVATVMLVLVSAASVQPTGSAHLSVIKTVQPKDLERVAFADGPGPVYRPIPEPQPALGRETVQTFGKSEPGAPTIDKGADAWISDSNDLEQFPELAHVLRTELTRLEAQRTRRSHRREARRLDREGDGDERRHDGVRVSPAAFLRSELRGVSGMGFSEMLRR